MRIRLAIFALALLLAFPAPTAASPSFVTDITPPSASLSLDTRYSATAADSDTMTFRFRNAGSTSGNISATSVAGVPAGLTLTCTSGCAAMLVGSGGTLTRVFTLSGDQTASGGTGTVVFSTPTASGTLTSSIGVNVDRRDAGVLGVRVNGGAPLVFACGAGQAQSWDVPFVLSNDGQSDVQSITMSSGGMPPGSSASGVVEGSTYLGPGATTSWTVRVTGDASVLQGSPASVSFSYSTTRSRPAVAGPAWLPVIPVIPEFSGDGTAPGSRTRVQVDLGDVEFLSRTEHDIVVRETCGLRGVALTLSAPQSSQLGVQAPTYVAAGSSATLTTYAAFSPGQSTCDVQRATQVLQLVAAGLSGQVPIDVSARPTFLELAARIDAAQKVAEDAVQRGRPGAQGLSDFLAATRDATAGGQACRNAGHALARAVGLVGPSESLMQSVLRLDGGEDDERPIAEAAAIAATLAAQCPRIEGLPQAADACGRLATDALAAAVAAASAASSAIPGVDDDDAGSSQLERAERHALLQLAYEAAGDEPAGQAEASAANRHRERADELRRTGDARAADARAWRDGSWSMVLVKGRPVMLDPLAVRSLDAMTAAVQADFAAARAAYSAAGAEADVGRIDAQASDFAATVKAARVMNLGVVAGWVLLVAGAAWHGGAATVRHSGVVRRSTIGNFLVRGGAA